MPLSFTHAISSFHSLTQFASIELKNIRRSFVPGANVLIFSREKCIDLVYRSGVVDLKSVQTRVQRPQQTHIQSQVAKNRNHNARNTIKENSNAFRIDDSTGL